MLKWLWSSFKRILFFDINRILLWDVSRQPIPPILLKAFAGFVVAGLLLAMMVPALTGLGWDIPEWAPLLVILGTVAAFMAIDLRRPVRR